jgi:hypothetical protein
MSTNQIRTAALAAVAKMAPDEAIVYAAKAIKDETGCDLRTAVEAIRWAQARPDAATLPVGSIVATTMDVWIKREHPTEPWVVTGASGWRYTDADISEMVRADVATILRIGDGS